jgi:hypothetical protein
MIRVREQKPQLLLCMIVLHWSHISLRPEQLRLDHYAVSDYYQAQGLLYYAIGAVVLKGQIVWSSF